MTNEDIKAISILFCLWVLNLELNPGLGRIIIRPDPEGKLRFALGNVVRYIIAPFNNIDFWRPVMWDANVYTFVGIGFVFYKSLSFFESRSSI